MGGGEGVNICALVLIQYFRTFIVTASKTVNPVLKSDLTFTVQRSYLHNLIRVFAIIVYALDGWMNDL